MKNCHGYIDVDDNHLEGFTDVIFDNSFNPHINLPTRITVTSATCIDRIWSNVYESDIVCGIISETIADHMITFQCSDIDMNTSSPSELKKTFTKVDYDRLPPLLRNIDTEGILFCSYIDQAYSKLEQCVCEELYFIVYTKIKF